MLTTELMAIAERRMRAEIETIPDGVYTFEDAIEDDGITDHDYPMKLRLTIDGGEVIADFTGSAPQAVGPVNAIYRRDGVGDLQRLPPPHGPDRSRATKGATGRSRSSPRRGRS